MSTNTRYASVTPVVEKILQEHPVTRNSDRHLLLWVFSELGLELTREQALQFLDMPSIETITRVRRKLQEQGKYQASESVQQSRANKAMVMEQVAPSMNSEQLESYMTEQVSLSL